MVQALDLDFLLVEFSLKLLKTRIKTDYMFSLIGLHNQQRLKFVVKVLIRTPPQRTWKSAMEIVIKVRNLKLEAHSPTQMMSQQYGGAHGEQLLFDHLIIFHFMFVCEMCSKYTFVIFTFIQLICTQQKSLRVYLISFACEVCRLSIQTPVWSERSCFPKQMRCSAFRLEVGNTDSEILTYDVTHNKFLYETKHIYRENFHHWWWIVWTHLEIT